MTRARQGTSLTAAKPVCEPRVKQELGRTSHADIADMESYWIARIAAERQVPFLAVWVVSDDVNKRLPPFDEMMDSRGRLRWEKAIPHFVVHPTQLVGLFGLYRDVRRARLNLTDFIDRLAEGLA